MYKLHWENISKNIFNTDFKGIYCLKYQKDKSYEHFE